MAKAAQANEPSMEEILASIRKIISDEEATAKPVPSARAESAPSRKSPAEIAFDRQWEVEAAVAELETVAVSPEAGALSVANDDDDAEADEPGEAPEPEPEREAVPPPEIPSFVRSAVTEQMARPALAHPAPRPAAAPANDPRLLSPGTDAVVSDAFNRLASTILSSQTRTLEDLVQDMLRPMLRGWLDDNLPTMVERLVREEIERVSRGPRR